MKYNHMVSLRDIPPSPSYKYTPPKGEPPKATTIPQITPNPTIIIHPDKPLSPLSIKQNLRLTPTRSDMKQSLHPKTQFAGSRLLAFELRWLISKTCNLVDIWGALPSQGHICLRLSRCFYGEWLGGMGIFKGI